MKKSSFGATEELNYAAIIISIFIRYVERIPTIEDLVKILRHDIAFKLDCGFLLSDAIPSEASYSRLITKLMQSDFLEKAQEMSVEQAIKKVLLSMTQSLMTQLISKPAKEEKEKTAPKKRGRKPKEDREKWLKEQVEKKANLPLYEKKIETQLDASLAVFVNKVVAFN